MTKIKNISSNYKDNNPLKAPDGYFEAFEDHMMNFIHTQEQSSTQKIINLIKPWLTLAAIFIAITLTFQFIKKDENSYEYPNNIDQLYSDLEYELSEDDIIEFIIEENLNLEESELELSDFSDEEIDELIMF